MALLEDLQEPPSQPKNAPEKIKNLKNFTKIKNYFSIPYKKFLSNQKLYLRKTFHTLIKKEAHKDKAAILHNLNMSVRFFPHAAVLFLVMVVMVSNQRDKITAQASAAEMIAVNPDVQYNVASTVDRFTEIIPDDGSSVERSTIAMISGDGFVNNNGTALTISSAESEAEKEDLPDNSAKTIDYIVQAGDTLTGLGYKFEVKLATLKYVNDISNIDSIKPGSKLKIPPKNYEVSPALIAKKEAQLRSKLASTAASKTTSKKITYKAGTKYNGYPYGYCTYYVATIRNVPSSWGDAKKWLGSAQRSGYATGSTPAAGAIVVTSESWWGHVAFVESVNGDTITISEMNAKGWGVTSRRTLSAYGGVVRGYIY